MLPNRIKLTDVTILSLKTEGHYWDLTLPGFGVRVGRNRKTFLVMRNRIRKRLGHYPAMSLADARRRAVSMLYGDTSRASATRPDKDLRGTL